MAEDKNVSEDQERGQRVISFPDRTKNQRQPNATAKTDAMRRNLELIDKVTGFSMF